jgi:uracil-DNA glycosylase family 4
MGFFKSSELHSHAPIPLLPRCGECGLKLDCKSPLMPVFGEGVRKILLVGEAPGQTEDQWNKPFVGKAGQYLRKELTAVGIDMDEDCWTTNAVICRPRDKEDHNRTPTAREANYCLPNLINAIKRLQPEIIIPLGGVPVRSLIGNYWKDDPGSIGRWVGFCIPCTKPNAWICPNWHPSYLIRSDKEKDSALRQWFRRYLQAAVELPGRPWQEVPDYPSQVRVILDPGEAAKALRRLTAAGRPVAFDYETASLKPDEERATIFCCSVADADTCISYPWHGEAIHETGALLRSPCQKIASNLQFEERWTWRMFDHGVENWYWDTVLGAHWMDSRRGITSIKFQAFVLLGAPDYDAHIKPYLEGPGGYGHNRIKEEVELRSLLTYCGLDSLLEYKVAKLQLEQSGYGEIP